MITYEVFEKIDMRVGPAMSDVLMLGFPDESGNVTRIVPTKDVTLGGKLF